MRQLEWIKLLFRANKYRYRHDKGGIAYLHTALSTGQTVLDIGAHKAGYLYFMRHLVGDQGSIFAFEPQSKLFRYLSRLKSLFQWDNVTLERLALSDNAGVATLCIPKSHLDKGSSPGATMARERMDANFIYTEQVATDTIDAFCNRLSIVPDFLKIDVEGNELRVFRGGELTLRNHKPKILVEIEARHVGRAQVLQTFEFLQEMGYFGYFLLGSKRLPIAEFNFEKHQDVSNKRNYCNNFIFETGN